MLLTFLQIEDALITFYTFIWVSRHYGKSVLELRVENSEANRLIFSFLVPSGNFGRIINPSVAPFSHLKRDSYSSFLQICYEE